MEDSAPPVGVARAVAARLSLHDAALLDQAEFGEDPEAYAQVVIDSVAHTTLLITTAASAREVAAALGVNDSRVRQLRIAGKLWAIDNGGTWAYPALQFESDPRTGQASQQIRGIDEVFAALPRDLHPIAVAGFLSSPHPDLAIDGYARTPLDWLRSGGDVSPVLQLVEVADWASS
ncbi:DNA-binding protein [Mycolicibacter sp. MYC123]|uniref:DNA-binding protein n=1 Tax=[Mycobacterium] zoologicum TaxID=2872311 RepID=A0ABU5YPV3_9MYCO|nr:DNA-binding protein [Mycolicibacter sp. MYC123]MEB3052102.1 DNA-binding protein [Mycolicibacter sp. MYC123]